MLINVNKFYVPSESPFLWLPSHTHCIAVSMGQELGFYFLHKTNALGLRCTQRVTHMPAENGLKTKLAVNLTITPVLSMLEKYSLPDISWHIPASKPKSLSAATSLLQTGTNKLVRTLRNLLNSLPNRVFVNRAVKEKNTKYLFR